MLKVGDMCRAKIIKTPIQFRVVEVVTRYKVEMLKNGIPFGQSFYEFSDEELIRD